MTQLKIETAWALSKGERNTQEDVLHLWFEPSDRSGYIIIADGMGGHTSGDVASSLAVEAVDDSLAALWAQKDTLHDNMRMYLPELVNTANTRLAHYIKSSPNTAGMGTTLLTAIILEGQLYWASVGDSPLYLLRGKRLIQLNDDHSMARQIDQMVHAGQLTKEAAQDHPNRNALTSVIMGDVIGDMDCSVSPYEMRKNDILIAATDGISSLSQADLVHCILSSNQSAKEISASIIAKIDALKNPNQDNLALCVAKIT